MDVLSLWGKTGSDNQYHPLLYHMLDVAAVAVELGKRFPQSLLFPPDTLAYVTALHDLGKADWLFQNKSIEQVERLQKEGCCLPPINQSSKGYRHEGRSAEWLRDHLLEELKWGVDEVNVVAQAIGYHHSKINISNPEDDPRDPEVRRWKGYRDELAMRVHDIIKPAPWQPETFSHAGAAGIRFAGLLVLADWIASNECIYHYLDFPCGYNDNDYWEAAQREASLAVAQLGFCPVFIEEYAGKPIFTNIWPACKTLRPSQAALEDVLCKDPPLPGLAIIEAPMGEGKTEAAIYLAEYWRQQSGKSGAYIALPTGATSNQMHSRYTKFLQAYRPGSKPRLVHGMAWLIDDDTRRCRRRSWEAQAGKSSGFLRH